MLLDTVSAVDALVRALYEALPGWDHSVEAGVHTWATSDIAESWRVEIRRTEAIVAVTHDEVGLPPAAVHLCHVQPAVLASVLVALGAPEVDA